MCLRTPAAMWHSNGKTWNKRTSDLLYKNPHFFVITRPNQMEFSLKCRKIVIFSLTWNYTLIHSLALKVIYAESPIVIFFNGHMVVIVRTEISHENTGWPPKNGTVDTVDFSGLALINSYLFSPCWIEHIFLIIITPRSSKLVENFLFYE